METFAEWLFSNPNGYELAFLPLIGTIVGAGKAVVGGVKKGISVIKGRGGRRRNQPAPFTGGGFQGRIQSNTFAPRIPSLSDITATINRAIAQIKPPPIPVEVKPTKVGFGLTPGTMLAIGGGALFIILILFVAKK